jgi:rhodanese-related sulfurtransferase
MIASISSNSARGVAGPPSPERQDPRQARECISTDGALLVDVRGYDEFAACHATGALCIPLPDLERRAGELPGDRPILCICASGNRSQMAVERLRAIGLTGVTDIIGGTQAWEAAGLPVVKQRGVIPLERQVRGVAGSLVLLFSVLGFAISPTFHWAALFIGFMLTITSLLGICPMMGVLKLMPWNRVVATAACSR